MGKLEKLIEIANKEYGGNFTLIKFKSNWRCCFGVINDTELGVNLMAEGKTLDDAIENCIKNDTNAYEIMEKMDNGDAMLNLFSGVLNSLRE